jgi:hypothetical protein
MKGLALLAIAASFAGAAAGADWRDRFIDPQDGGLDASDYLLDHRGVLPVPILITEPAIGYGGGIAAVWFSESLRDVTSRVSPSGRVIPPDILSVALAGTENGTRFGALGGRFSFDEDRWRYRGGVTAMKINLDFYGIGGDDLALAYTLKGWATAHEVTRRIGASDHFLGARFLYMDLESNLRADFSGTGLTPREFAQKTTELGVRYQFDSRDNIFFTKRGIEGALDVMVSRQSFGSDNDFETYRTHVFAYQPFGERVVGAMRVDARAARGDIPFYQLPFIDMRGVPAARYQDENTGLAEIEGRYYFTPRWIGVAFLGAGRVWGRGDSFGDAGSVVSKGAGFRYLLARRLGLAAGIDVARGPEKTAWYIQFGNAWR